MIVTVSPSVTPTTFPAIKPSSLAAVNERAKVNANAIVDLPPTSKILRKNLQRSLPSNELTVTRRNVRRDRELVRDHSGRRKGVKEPQDLS